MRDVSWKKLDGLVPDSLDHYWQLTLKFLELARSSWPAILDERGFIEPAGRRDALIKAEAARLARKTDGPVIAAGSTGSIPATAELIATIARLPHGAVVLPGLDTDLDEDSWRLIAGTRAKALRRRRDTRNSRCRHCWRASASRAPRSKTWPSRAAASGWFRKSLRPAAATDLWRQRAAAAGFEAHADAALSTVTMIEAANAEDEALAIAVALREAVEEKKTAALVTPDRALARRVTAALERWKITAEDSGGDALTDTPAGIFARLAAETALGELAPVTLLALLKHPLLRIGSRDTARAVSALERAILRGPRPRAGTAGLTSALEAFRVQLGKFAQQRGVRSAPLRSAHRSYRRRTFRRRRSRSRACRRVAAARKHRQAGAPARRDCRAASRRSRGVVARRRRASSPSSVPTAPSLPMRLMNWRRAMRRPAPHFAVRLCRAVFRGAGWPCGAAAAASRDARAHPRAPGSAIDRQRSRGAWWSGRGSVAAREPNRCLAQPPDAPATRARSSGAPRRAFCARFRANARRPGSDPDARRQDRRRADRAVALRSAPCRRGWCGRWQAALDRGEVYLAWARTLDRPENVRAGARPAPRPPRAARPKRLSVTEIEHWLRDPYTIYAKHVLRLAPLDEVDAAPGAAERGTVIHNVLREFSERSPTAFLPIRRPN